jgi:predicted phosphate transport protein (TIGR00153 family)
MSLDSLLKIFVPKDKAFFPLFQKDAQNLIKASELLRALMYSENLADRESYFKQIKEVELAGDEITHSIYDALNKSFITPFDREDIHALASNIDNVVDSINGTSQRINLYKPKSYIPVFKEMAEVIYQASKEVEFSVNGLSDAGKNKSKIMQACINLNTLENKADDIYHLGISNLFDDERDTTELIKKKEILETLEKCMDKAEDISDIVKTILIKMA